jgi:hypothetical protein
MTLALGNRMRSDLRIRAPHLTSLHIQIDNTADAEDLLFAKWMLLPELHSRLRNYIISSRDDAIRRRDITTEYLMLLIAPILERDFTLATLTLRNITAYNNDDYEGTGRIVRLLFETFKYRVRPYDQAYGYGSERKLNSRWKPYNELIECGDELLLCEIYFCFLNF